MAQTSRDLLRALKNPDRLAPDFLKSVAKLCGHLVALDEPTARETLRFIIDGGSDRVLLTLGGMKEAAKALGLGNHGGYLKATTKERADLFRSGASATPAVWVRLGQVLEASERASGAPLAVPPGWPLWLKILEGEAMMAYHHKDLQQRVAGWSLEQWQALLRFGGLSDDLFARTYLDREAQQSLLEYYWSRTDAFSGWKEYLAPYVRTALEQTQADALVAALNALKAADLDFTPFSDLLVRIATGPSKTARDVALPLLGSCRESARPHLEKVLTEGDASSRNEAAQQLWRLFGKEAVEPLRAHLARESSERVRQTVEKLLAAPAEETGAEGGTPLSLPPLQIPLGEVPLSEEAKVGLALHFHGVWQAAMGDYENQLKQWNSPDRPNWMREKPDKPDPYTDEAINGFIRYLESGNAEAFASSRFHRARGAGALGAWLAPPGVQLIHLVRLAFALTQVFMHRNGGLWWHQDRDLEEYRGRCRPPFGLRELDTAVATLPGAGPGLVAHFYLQNNAYRHFADWEPEAIWPVFAEQPEILRATLDPSASKATASGSDPRRNAFRILGTMPQLPPGFISILWDIALGDSKVERPLAQAALHTVPDKASRVLVALADGRATARAAAAEWLGRLGDKVAIDPLAKAFRAEKSESVKGVILTALDRLGGDVSAFLDRQALLAEAVAGLAKKRPKGMEWVPLDTLPVVHWQDNGAAVDPRILQWWLVQTIQQKAVGSGPLLRRYLALCRTSEAEGLARFVLSAWIARNLVVPPADQAAARARADADKRWTAYSSNPWYVEHYKNDKENLYKELLQQYANQYLASAVNEKGMLAVTAAAGDRSCVQRCEQFIRKHSSDRPPQCKVLVELLGWMAHPLAIQVLLSLAARFRSKAIRKLADDHVRAVAEREGWTVDELADRTIPDAGFERPVDEQGRPVGDRAALVLDYGPRQFTVTLDDDLEPVITSAEGKVVKNPPAAAKADDPDKVKVARKAFSDAKKMVKEVVKRQSERLYEALCTQRSWSFTDWQRYLAHHPIAGRLCIRLAWAAFERTEATDGSEPVETFLGCFRPMEDRTLTNEKDEEVTFGPEVRVRLAHECNTPPGVGAAWLAHFADYDIVPPFAQFGRATYALPEDKRKGTEIKDFEGHLLTTFKLRGRATKLGWLRGDAEDGGSFHLYRKPFSSLELQAVLEFTGSMLPETEVAAALMDLFFTSIKGDRESGSSWGQTRLPLGRVPVVLLSEIYNDVKQIAADGSGYDPEWRKKSYF